MKSLHRLYVDMDGDSSEASDTMSLYGGLLDVALGADLDGLDYLTDNELNAELQNLSDEEDDGINVTIKPGIKPNYIEPNTRKVASVVVVPESTKQLGTTNQLHKPKSGNASVSEPSSSAQAGKKGANKNGSTKKQAKSKGSSTSSTSLIDMLSRVKVTSKRSEMPKQSTPKRARSPSITPNRTHPIPKRPANMTHALVTNKANPPPTKESTVKENRSYSDVTKETLHLKVCLTERHPTSKDLESIRLFLSEKTESAMAAREYVPLFIDSYIGKDGFYLICPDYSCAQWLIKAVESGIPQISSKLTVIPHKDTVPNIVTIEMVRVVMIIPTKKPKEFVLDTLAQLNRNINTESWRIISRRNKGATKSIFFMRIDRKSFDTINAQGKKVNWILGQVTVEPERQRSKAKQKIETSTAPSAVGHSGSEIGKGRPFRPSSPEVMDDHRTVAGLTFREGSAPHGKESLNNE